MSDADIRTAYRSAGRLETVSGPVLASPPILGTAPGRGAQVKRLARSFGLAHAPVLLSETGNRAPLAVTRLTGSGFEMPSEPIEKEAAFLLMLQLRPLNSHRMWRGGQEAKATAGRVGSISLFDLQCEPAWHLSSDFDLIFFHFTRPVLDEIAEELNARPVTSLACHDGQVDPVTHRLGTCLLPALDGQETIPDATLRQVILGTCTHIAQAHGRLRPDTKRRSGLSVRQERLAKEFLLSRIEDPCSLQEVARLVGLSTSHFQRAFTEAVGTSPHRWFTARRLDRALELVVGSQLTLSEIALMCGFTDQSHLTRMFTRRIGVPPGEWRRSVVPQISRAKRTGSL